MNQTTETEEKPLPFSAKINSVPISAPLGWLQKAVDDMKTAPAISLGYGFVMTLLGVFLSAMIYKMGIPGIYLSMVIGFLLAGPVLAVGLYSFSCQIEMGKEPVLGYCVKESRSHIKDMLIFAFMLLIVFMLWARSATAMHIFFPENTQYSAMEIAAFLGIGSFVGLIFSAIVFTASAFSLPMIMDRQTDAVTAVITSINAVLSNKATMFVWALTIFSCVLFGFATLFMGFIVVLPLIGHATWHAYRETVDASQWPEKEKHSS